MNMVKLNQPAPDFSLQGDDGETFRLSDHRGERVLVVFYPGDNTPVCTRQLCEYRDGIEVFSDLGVRLVGISPDSVESHREFRKKHDFPFVLLSDASLEVAQAWGCKGALGMKRAVFLVDEDGTVRYAHIEALALFRRRAEELVEVIRSLDEGGSSEGAS
jgi:peroxiredoxin Q/BCP